MNKYFPINNISCLLIFLFITMYLCGTVGAQQGMFPPDRPPDHDSETFKMMESLKIWQITNELEVDEKLSEKLFPRIRNLEQLRKQQQHERVQSLEMLKEMVKNGVPAQTLTSKIQAHFEMIDNHHKQQKEKQNSIFEILTPEQQAKYLILDMEFPNKIRKFMRKNRRGKFPGEFRGENRFHKQQQPE